MRANMGNEKVTGNKVGRKVNWFLLLRLTGIILFIIVISRTNLKELWLWMKDINRHFLAIAIGFQVFLLFVKALRWHILNSGFKERDSLLQRFGEFFESYAIGVITPGRLGELMKAGHAGKGSKMLDAGLKVLVERGLDFGIFFIIAGSAITLGILPEVSIWWGWITIIFGLMVSLAALFLLTSPRAVRWVEHLLRLVKPSLKLSFVEKEKAEIFLVLGLSLLSNASYFISCIFLGLGVGLDVNVLWLAGGVAFAGLINTIPVTIMGLGTREVTFLYVFSAFPRAQVLAFSGMVFLVAQAGGGVISMILGQAFLFLAKNKKK